MFKWWKSKPVAEVKQENRPMGFFSTDISFGKITRDKINELAFSIAFPRKPQDLVPVNEAGTAMDSVETDGGVPVKITPGAFGQNVPDGQLMWFASQSFIGYQCCALIGQHWLVDKACTMPARDAVRNGYQITVNDGTDIGPEVFDYIRKRDKAFKIRAHCVEFSRKNRMFGIRIAVPVIESTDPDYYTKPFNIDGVTPGSYKGMKQLDPYWITPELDGESARNPAALSFYEPTWWRVNGKRYHKSHLIIIRQGDMPDILKPAYLYGGVSIPQKIAERVYAAERTANEAPLLAMTKRLTVLSLDMTQVAADSTAFQEKMAVWYNLMNNFGIKVVGGEEKIEQFDTSLADLDAVIMTGYQLVAAIADTPATKLLGTQPKGFNATGDYEADSYRQFLESEQEHNLTPLVDRHHQLLIKSEVAKKFNIDPFSVEINWNSTDSPTAEKKADLNLKRAQTDYQLVQAGAIDGQDVRSRIVDDADSGYNGIAETVPDMPDGDDGTGGDIAMDGGDFDPVAGTWNGARLITHQQYLNKTIVENKVADSDYTVHVTPEFMDEGKRYRMIIDGHHSLAAAVQAGVMPNFVTEVPRDEVFNAVTREATDHAEA